MLCFEIKLSCCRVTPGVCRMCRRFINNDKNNEQKLRGYLKRLDKEYDKLQKLAVSSQLADKQKKRFLQLTPAVKMVSF